MRLSLHSTTILNLLILSAALGLPVRMLPAQAAAPESKEDKVSYSIGTNIGRGLKRDGLAINAEQLISGLRDAYSGAELKLTEEQMAEVMQEFQAEMQAKMAEMQKKMEAEGAVQGEKNVKEGTEFLTANGKKEGIVTTESGLQYQVITKGEGAVPKPTDTIKAHYHGTLIDGTVFDSSVDRGQPASFPVNRVIPGWTEALQLMPVGSKYKLFIPSDLAYGERGTPGGPIGPNSTLIFEVELLEIEQ